MPLCNILDDAQAVPFSCKQITKGLFFLSHQCLDFYLSNTQMRQKLPLLQYLLIILVVSSETSFNIFLQSKDKKGGGAKTNLNKWLISTTKAKDWSPVNSAYKCVSKSVSQILRYKDNRREEKTQYTLSPLLYCTDIAQAVNLSAPYRLLLLDQNLPLNPVLWTCSKFSTGHLLVDFEASPSEIPIWLCKRSRRDEVCNQVEKVWSGDFMSEPPWVWVGGKYNTHTE